MMSPAPVDGWTGLASLPTTGGMGLRESFVDPRVDPYLLWAQTTDFIDVGGTGQAPTGGPQQWFSVLVEVAHSFGYARDFARDMAAHTDWIRIADAYLTPTSCVADSHFCTARVTREFFAQLESNRTLAQAIERVILGAVARAPATPKTGTTAPALDLPAPACAGKSGVRRQTFVAVIDDRFGFAHRRFRLDEKSRLVAYWNQEDVASETRGFGYGSELSGAEIDALFATCRTADGRIDEDAVYRQCRQMPELDRRIAHGTHVLDLAGGYEPHEAGAAPKLVCVDLPRHVTEDTSGRALPVLVLDALRYVIDRVDAAGAPGAPLSHIVINLSYGMIAGPHDGSSILERAIDELIALREAAGARLEVVIPSGNFRLSRCHAELVVKPEVEPAANLEAGIDAESFDTLRRLRWRLQPDDATASFVEFWLRDAVAARGARIQVTSPDGQASPWVGLGQMAVLRAASDETPVCTVVYVRRGAVGDAPMILVATAPTVASTVPLTVPDTRARPLASAGTWTIRFETAERVEVSAWIQRDDFVFGYPLRGRQSRFEDGKYQVFDDQGRLKIADDNGSAILRVDTLNAIATGKRVRVVGGERVAGALDSKKRDVARYASVGADGKVPFTELCEDSDANFGRLAAGTRSGCLFAMNGTSVAAPQFARRLAEWLMKDPPAGSTPPSGNPVQATRPRR